ncbi:MAG: LLM class flavin-dependent oxidoreductase [Dehalococcoidia bacterium]|nr:LLM class flavin-dependent oxidoreductase [Dehalococcoidia bacterium]
MISSFSVMTMGQVLQGDGIGFDGIPANDRWYPNERLVEAFDMTLETAQLMEGLGYDTLWMAEHHFQREGYECVPNLLMLGLWLAQHTSRLKFGCAFNILPMWHPLRLAEDFATADILTNGRVVFGVGRGYHTREVETFAAPMLDADANRELFEEQVEVVLKAFNQSSFSHHGKHYTIPPRVPYRGYDLEEITLVPRPRNLPVETWQPIVSGSARGMDFMARHGIKGIILGTAMDHVDAMVREYQAANARYGRDLELGQDLALGLWMWLEDSFEAAKRAMRPLFEEHVKFAGPLGMLRYSDDQMKAVGPAGAATHIAAGTNFDQVLKTRAWFCGTSEDAIAHIKEIEARYPGLGQVLVATPMGVTRSQITDQISRFASEVMPAFSPNPVS